MIVTFVLLKETIPTGAVVFNQSVLHSSHSGYVTLQGHIIIIITES